MTLQWTAVAIFLYIEIGTLMLLMLPWIRPPVWKKIFKSRIVRAFESYSYIYSYALGGILFLLFFDAIREVKKYGFTESLSDFQYQVAQVDAVVHMRLFRAQRNLYISGFALFLWLVIRRMVDLLSREANLMASAEASMRQAQSATVAAHSLMKEKVFVFYTVLWPYIDCHLFVMLFRGRQRNQSQQKRMSMMLERQN
ncbi:unnamed protein product [Soboliphyme baturini]|uniref:Endoplasmic reticulum transmembrane protein n=1 Tax=Soboliphyme baturini TaxID=241478 RepID=A0A183IH85_9BILA|nr:unnamed protein product [Soboliphyme baturini]